MDRRPWVYAILDGVFAILYVVIARTLVRGSDATFEVGSYVLAAATVAAAAGTAARRPAGWRVAIGGLAVLLLGAVTLITLLVASAAFLRGVYGHYGKAASTATLALVLVAVELYALLPLFQLRYLLSGDGRRAAGMAAPR